MSKGSQSTGGGGGDKSMTLSEVIDEKVLEYLNRATVLSKNLIPNSLDKIKMIVEVAKMIQKEEHAKNA